MSIHHDFIDIETDTSYNRFILDAYAKPTKECGIVPGTGFGSTAEAQKKSFVALRPETNQPVQPVWATPNRSLSLRSGNCPVSSKKRKAHRRRNSDAEYVYTSSGYSYYRPRRVPRFDMGAHPQDLLDDPMEDAFLCIDVLSVVMTFLTPDDVKNFLKGRWDKRGLLLVLDAGLVANVVGAAVQPWIPGYGNLPQEMKCMITQTVVKQLLQ